MQNAYEIKISWKSSEKGRVCTASAISKNGEVLAKAHFTLPTGITNEFYRTLGNFGVEEIENLARSEIKFMIENPELFK